MTRVSKNLPHTGKPLVGNPVPGVCDEHTYGVETCSQPYRVTPGARSKAEVGEEPTGLNGRLAGDAVVAAVPRKLEGIVRTSERSENPQLIRTSGFVPGALNDTTSLFTSNGARNEATTNLNMMGSPESDFGMKLGELRERPASVFGSKCDPILSRAGRLDTAGVDRKVQRPEHKLSKLLTLTSAQLCDVVADEDMVHTVMKVIESMCINGATLPSDQSHVVLALRVFTWFRNPILRISNGQGNEVLQNGDYDDFDEWQVGGSCEGNAPGTVQDVYRLHWQTEEQLHWSFGTGLRSDDLGALAA